MLSQFIAGAICFGFFIAALFFFRFWKRTHDRLFLMFAISFLLLSVERIIICFLTVQPESRFYVYGIRLVAFCLLIYAILDKNRKNR